MAKKLADTSILARALLCLAECSAAPLPPPHAWGGAATREVPEPHSIFVSLILANGEPRTRQIVAQCTPSGMYTDAQV